MELLLLGLLITLLLIYWFLVAVKHPKNFPPGPRHRALPVIGDGLSLGTSVITGFEFMRKKYGDVVGFWLGPYRTVIISDFKLVCEVSKRDEFTGRPLLETVAMFRGGTIKNSTPGIIFSSGENWSEQRKFFLKTLKDLGFGTKAAKERYILDEVHCLCQSIESLNSQPVSVVDEFQIAILNILWRVMTGESFAYTDMKLRRLMNAISETIEEGSKTFNQLALVYKSIGFAAEKLGIFKGFLSTPELIQFLKETVESRRETYLRENRKEFIDMYLKQIDKANKERADSTFKGKNGELNLVSILMDTFIAGSDSMSITLNWAMLYMILHPDVQRRVQDELDQATGRLRLPNMSDLQRTPYTEATIYEIQRLADLAPNGGTHCATVDCNVGDYFIPKDTQVMFSFTAIMHDPKHFPNPYKFDPMRYIDENGHFRAHPRMISFGLGKRNCPGKTLAKMELYLIFGGILSKFNVAKGDESEILTDEPNKGALSAPKPYKARFIPRP